MQLHGFDISLDQCPPQQWVSPNIQFRAWDAFGEVPAELRGQYDIVHLRLFMVNIKDNDASVLIENIYQMLSEWFTNY